MSFNSNEPRVEYTATASQTVFPFLFKVYQESEIVVYLTPTGNTPDDTTDLLTLTTDYTVTINGDAGGSITLVTPATLNDAVTITRSLDITRTIEYQTSGDLLASTLNTDQEYQTYLTLDQNAKIGRYLKFAENAQGINNILPNPVADGYLKWNASANAVENDTAISGDIAAVAADVAAAAASAAAAAASETNAASSASAASTSETNAGTSETNAASSASSASTSATNAATSATNAATSATNAATSETNAATSETNAGTSETNAAASATSAEAAWDSFDDRYLGSKASDPSVDNDGDALLTGALYYNTTTSVMKVYNGSTWEGFSAAGDLSSLSDTTITTPSDGQLLTYDNATGKWINLAPASQSQQLPAPSINSPADTTKNSAVSYTVSNISLVGTGTRTVTLNMGTTSIDTPTSSEGTPSIVSNTVVVTGVTSASISVGANYTSSGTFSVQAKVDAPSDSNYTESSYTAADSIAVLLDTPALDAPADNSVNTDVTYTIGSIDANANKIIFDVQSADFTYVSVSSGSGSKVGNTIEITGYTGSSLTVTLQYTVAATYNNRAKVVDTGATYPDSAWSTVDSIVISDPVAGFYGDRGVFGGGFTGALSNVIQYIDITTTGNSTDFGDLLASIEKASGLAGGSRGVFGGSAASNVMQYITTTTPGNAIDFGDLTVARRSAGALSSGIRGVFGGGNDGAASNVMDYITIDTLGNATDFGDLTVARSDSAGISNDTRGVFGGGNGQSNVMDYITIATTGNATDFGNLTAGRESLASGFSDTRGLFAGGFTTAQVNTIDYITVATTGNATDFGDLNNSTYLLAGASNGTRATFAGGSTSGGRINVIDYVTIATQGNATDFGDLLAPIQALAGLSGAAA